MAGLLHRTAQPLTLAAFLPWEGSAGAGRVRPAAANIQVGTAFLQSGKNILTGGICNALAKNASGAFTALILYF